MIPISAQAWNHLAGVVKAFVKISAHRISRSVIYKKSLASELLVQVLDTDIVRPLDMPHGFTFSSFHNLDTCRIVFMEFDLHVLSL